MFRPCVSGSAWIVAVSLTGGLTLAAPEVPVQLGEDPPTVLKPLHPRTAEEQNRVEALAHYATGRMQESRGQNKEALASYMKAVELDPQSIEIYRSLVPLAMQLDQVDQAIELAKKAVELDPSDYELQLQIGLQFARQQDFAASIRYFEQALQSSRLEPYSPTAVVLNVELGVLYQITGQPQKAADCYAIIFEAIKNPSKFGLDFRQRAALLADPRTTYERIGQVLIDGDKLEMASEVFDQASKSNRVSAGNLIYYRAQILLLSNKPEEALTELQSYLDKQRQSKGRDAYQLLAEILDKLNRRDELVGRLEKLAAEDPRNRQLQYFYADALTQAGELEQARKVYELVLESGGDAAGYLGLAGVLRRMQRADELLDALGRGLSKLGDEGLKEFDTELKAVLADKPLVDALIAAGRTQAAAEPTQLNFEEAYLLGKLTAELEQYDTSIEFFRKAAALDKDRAVVAFRDLAEVLMQAHRYSEAAVVCRDALDLRLLPAIKGQFLYDLSRAAEMSGDTAGALEAVKQGREEFPQATLFEFQEAWIYYHSRQFDKAVDHFQQILDTYKDEPSAKQIVRQCQFSLSAIYSITGKVTEAEKILEDIYAQEPNDPSVNNDLGYLYADQGKNLEKAESMIRKAVTAEPENAAYLDSLGWVLFKLGKFSEALEPLEKAVKLQSSSDGTIRDHLGDLYLRLDRRDDAVKSWTEALKEAESDQQPDPKLIDKIKTKLKDPSSLKAAPAADPKNP